MVIIYIFYITSPIQKILYRGEVTKVDHEPLKTDDISRVVPYMSKEQENYLLENSSNWKDKEYKKIYSLIVTKQEDDQIVSFEQIKICGLKNIRRATKINRYEKLVDLLEGQEEFDLFDFSEYE